MWNQVQFNSIQECGRGLRGHPWCVPKKAKMANLTLNHGLGTKRETSIVSCLFLIRGHPKKVVHKAF